MYFGTLVLVMYVYNCNIFLMDLSSYKMYLFITTSVFCFKIYFITIATLAFLQWLFTCRFLSFTFDLLVS